MVEDTGLAVLARSWACAGPPQLPRIVMPRGTRIAHMALIDQESASRAAGIMTYGTSSGGTRLTSFGSREPRYRTGQAAVMSSSWTQRPPTKPPMDGVETKAGIEPA